VLVLEKQLEQDSMTDLELGQDSVVDQLVAEVEVYPRVGEMDSMEQLETHLAIWRRYRFEHLGE